MDNKTGNLVKFPGYVFGGTPDEVFSYFNDFTEYAAGDWTVSTTEAGSGDATEAIVTDGSSGNHGVLLMTTDYAADDFTQIQGPEMIKLEAGKPAAFKCRVKFGNTGTAEWCIGLAITNTDPMPAGAYFITDAICFVHDTGATADTCVLRATKDSTAAGNLESDTGALTIADDTFTNLAFYYDGNSKIIGYQDGVIIGEITTNIPDNEYLGIIAQVNCSTTGTETMAIDYVGVWQQR